LTEIAGKYIAVCKLWEKLDLQHLTETAVMYITILVLHIWPYKLHYMWYCLKCFGVLASEGWWKAWQPSPKVTRSY